MIKSRAKHLRSSNELHLATLVACLKQSWEMLSLVPVPEWIQHAGVR